MGQNAEKIIFVASNTHKYVAKEGGCNLICRRAPHGARGLKPLLLHCLGNKLLSRPARGAWIETSHVSHGRRRQRSRPARGAWIETTISRRNFLPQSVAPRTGRVD